MLMFFFGVESIIYEMLWNTVVLKNLISVNCRPPSPSLSPTSGEHSPGWGKPACSALDSSSHTASLELKNLVAGPPLSLFFCYIGNKRGLGQKWQLSQFT